MRWTPTRRNLAQLLGGGTTLVLVPPHGGLVLHPPDAAAPHPLSAVLPRTPSAQVVGREYLRLRPEEADASRLLDLVAASLRPSPGPAPARLGAAVARQVASDFAEERVVRLQGWVVSVTEARLCAAATLAGAQPGRGA